MNHPPRKFQHQRRVADASLHVAECAGVRVSCRPWMTRIGARTSQSRAATMSSTSHCPRTPQILRSNVVAPH
jgi:hypothetical protein